MKTFSKKLEPGKWRWGVEAGKHVVAVRLKGMRNRMHDLLSIPKDEFMARLQKRPNGEIVEAAVLRGIPSAYLQDGPFLMIWPAPVHNWEIEFDTIQREKKNVA